jgi:hypothetical protein
MTTDPWKLKASTAKYLVCQVCGNGTRWGQRRGRYRVCDEHDSWRTYFKIITKRIPPHPEES